jgi:hypothetical protein
MWDPFRVREVGLEEAVAARCSELEVERNLARAWIGWTDLHVDEREG